jgi:GTP-binding protein EngB required for normal cell division
MSRRPDLPARLDALRHTVELGQGRIHDDDLEGAQQLLAKADARLLHGTEHTVAALAGATGSGKSTLFNALCGAEVSDTGVRRPTTGEVHACVFGTEADPGRLLDWMEINHRHLLGAVPEPLEGLVLLDLPDHDSVRTENRMEMERVSQLVDLLVWVTDPEKYADAALHDYLRRYAGHSETTLVAINKIDRLAPDDVGRCRDDLRRLLETDGLTDVGVAPVSATTGEGVDVLRERLGRAVERREAAVARLTADCQTVAAQLETVTGSGKPATLGRRDRARLSDALGDAAGVGIVADAVDGAYRREAALATGWPMTRWVRRFRPDPLRRLHLGEQSSGRTSLPRPAGVQTAAVTAALRDACDATTENLEHPWPHIARTAVGDHEAQLRDELDLAVREADPGAWRDPLWWKLVGSLQLVAAAAAVIGLLWLLALFGFTYLRLPEPPTPEVSGFPVPTLALIGGVAVGLLLALLARPIAAVGAKRRSRAARQRMLSGVETVIEARVVTPLEHELATLEELRKHVAVAGHHG